MTTDQPRRQDIDASLTNARQTIALLRSQVNANQYDRTYFLQRLDAVNEILESIISERQGQVDTERFAKLYEVSKAIGSTLDLEEVLQQVMDAIIALTGAERGYLMLLNDDGVLEFRIARNLDQETLDSGEFAVSRTITRQVFENGTPIVTTNAAEDPRYAGQVSIITHQLRSIMATPLRARGTIIGVIYVDNRVRTGLFREKDLEIMEAFAGQAAVAIDNARLFSETDEKLAQRVEESQMLQWIDRQLNETLDLRKAMDLTVEWTLRMCSAKNTSLAMIDSNGELQIMSQVGEQDSHSQQYLSAHHPLIEQVFESGQPVVQISLPSLDAAGTLLCVPIKRENRTIGVIVVYADRADAFDMDEQALVARIADRAAIAIENARLYDEVKQANQAKSVFVGTVAHELKAPMTSISGYADLLLHFSSLNEQELGYVTRIKDGTLRMRQLVDDLSDISRIESGNLRVELTEVDVAEVIARAKESVMIQVQERDHRLVEHIDSDLPPVKADPARVVQVLINLLSNAYKYTPEGGEITIQAYQQNGQVMIGVKDTGVGMSPEELHKLGTKFWRSSNEYSVKQRGTGLGISITRNLIELMRGTLSIESEVGKGSTFTVGLPIIE
jgi:K+-sensing histidine kinase KdpD